MTNEARILISPEEALHSEPEEGFLVSLSHSENPNAKKLLDVVISILAEEYVQTAQENPDIFSK